MAGFDQQIADDVLAATKLGAAEASAALSRALDAKIELAEGQPSLWSAATKPDDLAQPGLAVVMHVEDSAAVFVIPAATGLLPAWCEHPDATGASKLATLAQELGMLLLPEQFMPVDFKAEHVANLAEALERGGVPDGAGMIGFRLNENENPPANAYLIWPAPQRDQILARAPAELPIDAAESQVASEVSSVADRMHLALDGDADFSLLPPYARSLLRISVPIMVTLARKRQRVGSIVELSPGAIIQFEKSCDELLELEVSGRPAAQGECVKVGDKFGLRITSMIMPEESFKPIGIS